MSRMGIIVVMDVCDYCRQTMNKVQFELKITTQGPKMTDKDHPDDLKPLNGTLAETWTVGWVR